MSLLMGSLCFIEHLFLQLAVIVFFAHQFCEILDMISCSDIKINIFPLIIQKHTLTVGGMLFLGKELGE